MAVPVWPLTLPQRFKDGSLREGAGDGRLRTPMDLGPAKMRPRVRPMRPLSGVLSLTAFQRTTLDAFMHITGDTAGGTLPFYFPNPTGGAALLVQFGEQMPEYTTIGRTGWSVQLWLEVFP